MESKEKKELVRIAGYQGVVSVDPTGKAKGRGVYLCPNKECLGKAIKKNALARSLGMDIQKERLDEIMKELAVYEGRSFNDDKNT